MGRTLSNTMLNMGIQNACDEALYQVIVSSCLTDLCLLFISKALRFVAVVVIIFARCFANSVYRGTKNCQDCTGCLKNRSMLMILVTFC